MRAHRTVGMVVISVAVLLAGACTSSSTKQGANSSTPTSGSSGSTATSAPTNALPDVNQHFQPSGALTASAPGVTPTTIKLGFITSETGIAASTFKDGAAGAKARVALQNAQGGIDGRQIELVTEDDGTIGPKAAAQDLIENKGVFGVVDVSAFVFVAAPYMNQKGVPVTGGGFDGPEWGQQPNTNMFSFGPPVYTPFDSKYYAYDNTAQFLKSIGVTKLATFSYGVSQSAIQSNKSTLQTAAPYGISKCYENDAVNFGQTSFTTEALAMQQKGCDGSIATMVDASDVGLSAALKQAGLDAKQFYYTGYDQAVLDDSNASTALDGAYFPAGLNFTDPPPGIQGMLNALHKYAPSVKGIPDLGVYGAYLATDIMIGGLDAAGQNPTRAAFITNLRKVAKYDGHGLFAPAGLIFTGFGTTAMFAPQSCTDYVQLKSGKFVTVAKQVCGKLVATHS